MCCTCLDDLTLSRVIFDLVQGRNYCSHLEVPFVVRYCAISAFADAVFYCVIHVILTYLCPLFSGYRMINPAQQYSSESAASMIITLESCRISVVSSDISIQDL